MLVEMTYNVRFEGSPTWTIGSSLVKHVDNKPFLALRPHEAGLIRLLAHNHVDLPPKQRFCLTHCPGFQKLLSLRNEIAFKAADPAASAAESLFAQSDASQRRTKAVKLRASQLQDIRNHAEILDVHLPGVGTNPDLIISVLRPAHPCDHIHVHLDGDTLEAVAMYIRFHGMGLDSLTMRRTYNAGADGVWRNGSAGIVRRMEGGQAEVGKKYQRVKQDDLQAPALADHESADDGVDDALPPSQTRISAFFAKH